MQRTCTQGHLWGDIIDTSPDTDEHADLRPVCAPVYIDYRSPCVSTPSQPAYIADRFLEEDDIDSSRVRALRRHPDEAEIFILTKPDKQGAWTELPHLWYGLKDPKDGKKRCTSLEEILRRTDNGETVFWNSTLYKVIKGTKRTNYMVTCSDNDYCTGLTSLSGKLNGKPEEYFVQDEAQDEIAASMPWFKGYAPPGHPNPAAFSLGAAPQDGTA